MSTHDEARPGDLVIDGERTLRLAKISRTRFDKAAVFTNLARGVPQASPERDFRDPRWGAHPCSIKPGEKGRYSQWDILYHGRVVVAVRDAKCVPVNYVGGRLDKRDYLDVRMCWPTSDDPNLLDLYDRADFPSSYRVNMSRCALVHACLTLPAPVLSDHAFTKTDLIAYVVKVNGERKLTRKAILEKVAALEGKPWIPTSNTDYFMNVPSRPDIEGHVLYQAGRGPHRAILYGLGPEGERRAEAVIAQIGSDPGRV